MKSLPTIAILVLLSVSSIAQNKLETVATFPSERPGNITVATDGRVFVTMSALSSSKYMVKEILPDGTAHPFGEEAWIMKPKKNSMKGISSTIGIQADTKGMLWVLDMGDLPTGHPPKLVGFSLSDGKMKKVFLIPTTALTDKPFLQDFVIDEKHNVAVIADMTDALRPPIAPAFVVVDLETGNVRRVVENHASFQPVDEPVRVASRLVSHKKEDGTTIQPRYPLNPIAIDQANDYVYYGAMGNTKIYRVATAVLADETSSEATLEKAIAFYASKPKSDGFKVGPGGKVYTTDVENSAVVVSSPEGTKTLAQDKTKLSWPDGVALHDGYLYIVANQLHNLALLNEGEDVSNPPFYVLKMKIDQ